MMSSNAKPPALRAHTVPTPKGADLFPPNGPHVLFLNHTSRLGGAEQYLYDLITAFPYPSTTALFEDGDLADDLRAIGADVHVVDAPSSMHSVRREATVIRLIGAAAGVGAMARDVARLARDVDIIFANSQKSMLVASLAGKMTGTPVVWSLHDLMTGEHFSYLNRQIARLSANLFVDRMIANSQATLDAFEAIGGRVPATVIPNGINASRFTNREPGDRQRLRRAFDIPSDAPVAGVFSRIAEWKGQDVLIRAMTAVPSLHVVIVGEAMFDGDEAYAETLHALVRELDLADRVHFAGFRRDIPALMHMVDIVVHTSKSPEPFGRVIVEGLLAERTVVATAAGGAAEILSTPGTGYLVDPGDVSQLSETLSHIVSHPEEATTFARSGKALSMDRYTLPTMVRSIANVLTRVV
jgi:glycosyltransferase involved in cell wall biosynthesis